MEDFFNDVEEDVLQTSQLRRSRKKMKKRRQLNALLKFRPTKLKSNSASDDQLFLSYHTRSTKKKYKEKFHFFCRCFRYSFIFILVVFWVLLLRSNVNLRSEVYNLSQRLIDVEQKFPQNVSSIIQEIQNRWNLSNQIEKLNDEVSKLKIQQFLSQSLRVQSSQLEKFNESFVRWSKQLNNQTARIETLVNRHNHVVDLVHNTSDKTSAMLNEFQSNLNRLRTQVEQCKC